MASGGGVKVYILGDSSGAQAAIKEAEASLRQFGTQAKATLEKTAAESDAAFAGMGARIKEHTSGIGKTLSAAFGGLLVAGGVAGVLRGIVDEGKQAAAAQALLANTLHNVGLSYAQYRGQIEEALAAQSKQTAFTNDELTTSFTDLLRVTHNVNDAMRLNSLAADIARQRNMSLQQAAQLLDRTWVGYATSLTRLGIEVPKFAHNASVAEKRVIALNAVQQQFGGAAEAWTRSATGQIASFETAWKNLEEQLSKKVMPVLAQIAGAFTNLLGWMTRNGQTVKEITEALGIFAGTILTVTVAMKAWAAIQAVLNVELAANPIGVVIVSVAALTAAVVVLYDRFKGFRDYINNDLWPAIKSAFQAIKDTVLGVFDQLKNSLLAVKDFFTGNWSKLGTDLKNISLGFLGGLWRTFLDAGKSIGEALGSGIVNALISAVNAAAGVVNKVIHGINKANIFSGLTGNIPDIPTIGSVNFGGGGAGGAQAIPTTPAFPGAYVPPHAAGTPTGGSGVGTSTSPLSGAYGTAPASALAGPAGATGGGRSSRVKASGAKASHGPSVDQLVEPAIQFANGQLGKPYRRGGGHAYGTWSVYDCSGFASDVAGHIPGYTGGYGATPQLLASGTPAKGDEPVLFGFTNDTRDGVYPGHMAIRLLGVWYQAGSPVHTGTGGEDFSILRVPAGLAYLTTLSTKSSGGKSPGLSVASRFASNVAADTNAIASLSAVPGNAGTVLAAAGATLTGHINTTATSGYQAFQELKTRDAAQTAYTNANPNASAAKVTAAGDKAVDELRQRNLTAQAAQIDQQLRTAAKNEKELSKSIRDVLKALPRATPRNEPSRRALLSQANGLRKQRDALLNTISGLIAARADITEQLAEVGYDLQKVESVLAAADTTSSASSSSPSSAVDQALLAQANQRAAIAQNQANYDEAFITTALGPGDSITGGRTEWQTAGGQVTINVQALTPGDPGMLQKLAGTITAALGYQGNIPAGATLVGA